MTLLEALKFVSIAQTNEQGAPYQKFCKINNNWVVATDGILTVGAKIEDDLSLAPDTLKMIGILEQCNDKHSMTQLTDSKLAITSNDSRAVIDCLANSDEIPLSSPDPVWGEINDKLKEAFSKVAPLAEENSQEVALTSILLNNTSCVSTDKTIIFECWHGINMPIIAIPVKAVKAIARCKKTLVKFGYSDNSATFYFDDGSYIKTQTYENTWPDISRVLNLKSNPQPIPETFFEKVDSLKLFAKDDRNCIYLKDGAIASHANPKNVGMTRKIEGVESGPVISIKYLDMIKRFATKIDFNGPNNMVFFFGENIRGVISGMRG